MCIDCKQVRTIMLHQHAQVGRRTVRWCVCLPCHRAYERHAAEEAVRYPAAARTPAATGRSSGS